MEHLQSDLCSALELAVNDCYCLDGLSAPEFVVDGGGNTGLFTLAASARWPNAQFVICEPVPANLEILRENLALNRLEAQVLPVCLGDAPGRTRFFCREANQGSFSPELPFRSVIEVGVRTLSEVCRGHEGEQTLVKLDIEGAELGVLEEFFAVQRPRTVVVGELHQHSLQKKSLCELTRRAGWNLQFLREDTQTSQFQMFSPDQTTKTSSCLV
jgi:FkbM family methyltransferase